MPTVTCPQRWNDMWSHCWGDSWQFTIRAGATWPQVDLRSQYQLAVKKDHIPESCVQPERQYSIHAKRIKGSCSCLCLSKVVALSPPNTEYCDSIPQHSWGQQHDMEYHNADWWAGRVSEWKWPRENVPFPGGLISKFEEPHVLSQLYFCKSAF